MRAPLVSLKLLSRPQTLTLVRGMLAGVAELLALEPELLDDVKTAASEAANNVVLHAYGDQPGPLEISLYADPEALEVVVRDHGRGISAATADADHDEGIGLPLIRALTSELHLGPAEGAGGGTEVRMRFVGSREGAQLFQVPEQVAAVDGFTAQLTGETVASVSPVALVGGVLGRLARALAADVRFSLDRFSDIYLVTDAIAAQAAKAAAGERIAFSLQGGERRLELAVGPFLRGTGAGVLERQDAHAFPLVHLTDDLAVEPVEQGELLRATLVDPVA